MSAGVAARTVELVVAGVAGVAAAVAALLVVAADAAAGVPPPGDWWLLSMRCFVLRLLRTLAFLATWIIKDCAGSAH